MKRNMDRKFCDWCKKYIKESYAIIDFWRSSERDNYWRDILCGNCVVKVQRLGIEILVEKTKNRKKKKIEH